MGTQVLTELQTKLLPPRSILGEPSQAMRCFIHFCNLFLYCSPNFSGSFLAIASPWPEVFYFKAAWELLQSEPEKTFLRWSRQLDPDSLVGFIVFVSVAVLLHDWVAGPPLVTRYWHIGRWNRAILSSTTVLLHDWVADSAQNPHLVAFTETLEGLFGWVIGLFFLVLLFFYMTGWLA